MDPKVTNNQLAGDGGAEIGRKLWDREEGGEKDEIGPSSSAS